MKKITCIKIKKLLLVLAVFCFSACKELPEPEEFDPSDSRLHVVWNKPFLEENTSAVMQDPILADRYVAWAGYYQFTVGDLTNRIDVFDKTNGERHPAWRKNMEDDLGYGIRTFVVDDNSKDILYYTTSIALHAIRISGGHRLWTSGFDEDVHHYGNLSVLGSDATIPYYSRSSGACGVHRYYAPMRQKTNLFSFHTILSTIQWAVNEHNNTVGFFFGGRNRYCYNLTQDSIVWECPISDYRDYPSFSPIVVENKYVLFQHKYDVSCIDFSTGELIWEKYVGYVEESPILYHEGKIIVRPHYGNISCYDVRNGDLLWTSTDVKLYLGRSAEYGKMDTYKGNLYFTNGGGNIFNPNFLYCISLATGKVNWHDAGPNKGGILGGLVIDQQTGYLYCHSNWSVMCVDLNKTPKK